MGDLEFPFLVIQKRVRCAWSVLGRTLLMDKSRCCLEYSKNWSSFTSGHKRRKLRPMVQSIARPAHVRATAATAAPEVPSVVMRGPQLTIVVPTRNERDNVNPVYDALCRVLHGVDWEVVFVDDDSKDGTVEAVCRLANSDRRVRCIRRMGRCGLASACIEGILASSAPYVAVMDADL